MFTSYIICITSMKNSFVDNVDYYMYFIISKMSDKVPIHCTWSQQLAVIYK